MLQNATLLRKSAPWPPNISHEHVFCTAPATRNASWQILFKCPTPAMVFGNATRFAHFWQGAQSLAPATRNDIWTSKSGASMWCFVHFDFETCFAPQRRALFRHLNFQKRSDTGVFCTFWLRNVLRATSACTFSTSQLPKVVRTWCVLHIFTSKCASRHNGVQFFIIWPDGSAPAALASLLFDPEPQIIGKTQCCASASSFFWLFLFYHLLSSALLFSLPLPSSAFHLSILSEVWLLNFLRLCLGCDCFLPGWIRLILSHCILIISPVYGIEFIDFAALSICCFMVFISLPILDTLQKVIFLADERRYSYSSG